MQIVINLSKKAFQNIMDGYDFYDGGTLIHEAVRTGTVLPEKHGRIADMDEVIKCIEEVTGNNAPYTISLIEWACSKRTILEAREDGEE